jgi:hypothetical protein
LRDGALRKIFAIHESFRQALRLTISHYVGDPSNGR